MCSNGSVYHSDRSSPSPAHPIAPQTPRSVSLLSQLGQVCTNNVFVPNPPLSSSPSLSSGTTSSRGSSPHSSPVDRLVGDDYPYPYISVVEPPQYVLHPLNLSRIKPIDLLHTRFKPLFTSSWMETSTPPNESSHHVFQHVQQQLYEMCRPYKTEPPEPPLNQIPSNPYPPAFASDYANSNQRPEFTYQTPCEQYPPYSPAQPSVDYNVFPDQNPDYIIGTSSMRYTASSPPDQGCVSPAMVSDGSPHYVEMSELSPSPPVYEIPTQASACDPRTVSGFEELEQLTPSNLPLKRSPSATPPPMFAFVDQQFPEIDDTTPHPQQETEVYSSGESEVDRGEYEDEKSIQTTGPLEQPEPSVPPAVDHTIPSPSTSIPTLAPADTPSQPTHETEESLTVMVPPPTKRRRGQAGPVPVPNLTKKSRGRSVPTAPNSISPYGVHRARRSFICGVTDCGKCFARGEHLKRHIRSIHTNEKREHDLLSFCPI